MTSPMLQHIPLKSAYLCQDCDCVGNSATSCPACASKALLGLSCILNRPEAMGEISMEAFAFAPSIPAPLSSALAA